MLSERCWFGDLWQSWNGHGHFEIYSVDISNIILTVHLNWYLIFCLCRNSVGDKGPELLLSLCHNPSISRITVNVLEAKDLRWEWQSFVKSLLLEIIFIFYEGARKVRRMRNSQTLMSEFPWIFIQRWFIFWKCYSTEISSFVKGGKGEENRGDQIRVLSSILPIISFQSGGRSLGHYQHLHLCLWG